MAAPLIYKFKKIKTKLAFYASCVCRLCFFAGCVSYKFYAGFVSYKNRIPNIMHNPANLPYPSQNLLSISHFCVFLRTDKNNNMYVPSTQSKNQTTSLQLDV